MSEQRDNRVGKSRLTDTESSILVIGLGLFALVEIVANGWAGVLRVIALILIVSALS